MDRRSLPPPQLKVHRSLRGSATSSSAAVNRRIPEMQFPRPWSSRQYQLPKQPLQ
ncbi:hypothetical protein ZEAMMB73_Zm00001d003267 [Zea mays]|uniref:Uncharacterized protein n=1 Tax=Zea mays TaxID=4577 RepID=A0A1D6E850_MAIZE|nr:hypothetical protein ZEAMMB73_Zm00001d003267 [Zea mays]ONM16605.1 hypothetical protein ZEAMMB73_Zm00001d003267 [Zea mays]ONM16608.1 hypothetical protein ZEAMMB73_Zm00001d003267 [Zea mays]